VYTEKVEVQVKAAAENLFAFKNNIEDALRTVIRI